jgi:Predicted transcriptional regulators
MKEINIAQVLVKKRREKGITQDELANFMGVSKASVSKWETEQSYPDVTFLPVLASYFNISLDELMDYKPQMTRKEIQKLYRRLSSDFTSKPFASVMNECRKVIKKYYACLPLLLQMGILMVNHAELLKGSAELISLLEEARELFIRVKEESEDVSLTRKALYMEAFCNLAAGDANKALELLDGTVEPAMPSEPIMASAYQMTGRINDAKAILQVGIYQNIVVLFNFLPSYLMLCKDDTSKFDEVLRRACNVAESFDMRHLHPGILVNLYICAAQGYMAQNNNNKALDLLEQYTEIVTGDIYPLKLHSDSFFDLLDEWLIKLDLGSDLPRDEKTIRKSMCDVIVNNPGFSILADDRRFQHIAAKLQSNCGND